MSGNDSLTLTRKQRAAIVALLSERTVELAAAKVHVSERTVFRWLRLPAFQTALEQARTETVRAGLNKLRTSLMAAVDKLTDLMDGSNEQVALRAAVALLDHGTKAIETCDVLARVTALETLLEGQTP